MASYFIRMIRLFHFMQRFNGFSCQTFRYNEKFKIIVRWYDILLYLLSIAFFCCLLVFVCLVQQSYQKIYLTETQVLNFASLCGLISVPTYKLLRRKLLQKIIRDIDGIDSEVGPIIE